MTDFSISYSLRHNFYNYADEKFMMKLVTHAQYIDCFNQTIYSLNYREDSPSLILNLEEPNIILNKERYEIIPSFGFIDPHHNFKVCTKKEDYSDDVKMDMSKIIYSKNGHSNFQRADRELTVVYYDNTPVFDPLGGFNFDGTYRESSNFTNRTRLCRKCYEKLIISWREEESKFPAPGEVEIFCTSCFSASTDTYKVKEGYKEQFKEKIFSECFPGDGERLHQLCFHGCLPGFCAQAYGFLFMSGKFCYDDNRCILGKECPETFLFGFWDKEKKESVEWAFKCPYDHDHEDVDYNYIRKLYRKAELSTLC